MLTNFEQITHELDEVELSMVQLCINGFKSHGKSNPIKAPAIIHKFNEHWIKSGNKKLLTEPRLRKICNYIRSNGLLPLIATSEGYYTSYDKEEIGKQIQSLTERANSIQKCADGLKKFLVC